MSFFGKLKSLHGASPAPPRGTDNNTGWPRDELDDEDDDTYEAPPCERPAVKVQVDGRKVEENIYLERTSSPAVPQRRAAPPPRLGKASTHQQRTEDSNNHPNTKKPPRINRIEKPERKNKMRPPLPVCSAPAPFPASSTEEDVYLDPNEEQDDNEDLHSDPTAAYPQAPCRPRRMPTSPRTALASSPLPIMKPPVSRAKSNPVSSYLREVKTVEVRQVTSPAKVPPPTPTVKPPLSASLKKAKPSLSNPPTAETAPVAFSSGMRAGKPSGNEDKEWFAGESNRKNAEDLLLRVNKDGAFLIRHSSAQSARQPYTLAVLYQQKVYNIPIRFLEEARGYALGKEGKKNEEIFATLDEIISHHRKNRLLLIDSKSQAKHTSYLTHPVHPLKYTT